MTRFYEQKTTNHKLEILALQFSDRKQAELALLEDRNFVSAVLDTAGALILVLDQVGRIIHVNGACSQATGYCLEEVKGRYFWDLFLIPEEVEPIKAVFQELKACQFPKEYENYWVARDGSRRLISWSNTVILHADGSIKYVIGIGIDITSRKQAEEIRACLSAEKELRKLQLRFFSMAYHEFRTPLSTILVTAQLLEFCAQSWPEEKRLRNLRRIEASAKHMTHLLDEILTINRAETGKLKVNPNPIDLEKFCRHLVEEIQLNAGYKHKITFVSHSQCPNACMDEKLLTFILTNLLSNAVKYSPQGSEVDLALICEQQEAIFQIRGQGIGIPQEDQQHLFEPFYRGKNIENIPGTGLGLTVVKKCLDLQRGKISLNSEVGVGTTVTVTIPYYWMYCPDGLTTPAVSNLNTNRFIQK